jgi:structural maintenance of chromosome 4
MLEAYKRCLERFSVIKTSYVQISKEQDEIYSKKDELYGKRYRMFMEGFNFISLKLKECYQELTVHGDADLELHDSSDPFSMGILYSARPPKKTWKSMLKLSGGEKTIASLALIFALHYYKPAPLYFMDEIDAALDFNNVAIVGKFIKERT